MKTNRKAQLAGLPLVVITMIVAGILVALGVLLLQGFTNTTDNYVGVVINETGWMNDSGYTLSKSTVLGFNNPTITQVLNNTVVVTSANYTVSSTGVFYNATQPSLYQVNISYTYNYGQEAYRGSNKSVVGTASFADFWEIIILAVIISIVLGIILSIMSQKRVK